MSFCYILIYSKFEKKDIIKQELFNRLNNMHLTSVNSR